MKAMKKHFFFMLPVVTLLAAALLSSCSSSDDDVTPVVDPVQPEPALIHFTAQLGSKGGDGGSSSAKVLAPRRVVSDPDDGTLDAEWHEDEKVALIYEVSGISYLCQATVTSVSSGVATIDGTLSGSPADNTPVKIVYPYAAADKDTDSGIKADYLKTGQDGTLSTLSSKYDVAVGNGNLAVSGTDASLKEMTSVENQYAICKFTFNSGGTAITGITTVKVGDMIVRGSDLSSVYVAFDPSVSGVKRFTVINGTATYTGTASPSLQAGMFYRPSLTLSQSAYEAVDLGLESGLLWAKKNVGATNPQDYGDYFAWGETETYYSSQNPLTWKTDKDAGYAWASYFDTSDNGSSFNKYNTSGGKTVLESSDDAATANWGSAWRMPTKDEWDELLNAYPSNATSGNKRRAWLANYNSTSVAGLAFYDASGNIGFFLPAAGYRYDTNLYSQGSYGFYWSSSLFEDYSLYARYLYFYSGDSGMDYYGRYYGQSVRPVCAQ